MEYGIFRLVGYSGPPPHKVVIFLCPVCQLIKLQEGWAWNSTYTVFY